MTTANNFTARKAAHIGAHAFHGFHASKDAASAISRLPFAGPMLGLLVRGAGTVMGAVHGIRTVDE